MIVITGSSDGLGKELAKIYINAGKTVLGVSKSASETSISIVCDLSNQDSLQQAVDQILEIDEPLEAVINCAGVLSVEELNNISQKALKNTFAVNVEGPIALVSGLIDRIKKDGADIVNVSSTVGTKGYKDQAVYGASKWALRGFTANLQVELKDFPCRVISFCPGGFKTRLFAKATGIDNTEDGSEWMRAEDVAICLKQLLELPKNMEVSEIVINRKTAK